MEQLKKLALLLNTRGIAIPVCRDPKTGQGSITVSMVVVSFGICVIGVIGKVSKILDGVDLTAAHSLLVISLSAYLSRKFQSNGKDIIISKEEDKIPE